MRQTTVFGVVVLLALGACARTPSQPQTTQAVPVYDSTQIALERYSVLKRVGVDDWESAIRIRGHRDLETAKLAIVNEASRVGADGVINLTCFDQTDGIFNSSGYFCYGNAIRLKK